MPDHDERDCHSWRKPAVPPFRCLVQDCKNEGVHKVISTIFHPQGRAVDIVRYACESCWSKRYIPTAEDIRKEQEYMNSFKYTAKEPMPYPPDFNLISKITLDVADIINAIKTGDDND